MPARQLLLELLELLQLLELPFLCAFCAFAACRAVGSAKEGLLNLPQRWDKAHLLELIKEPE